MRRLERELGHELLDRSGRTVTLTEVGAAVLPRARAALDEVAGIRLVVDELSGLVRGHVAVGTVTSHDVRLADLLADFHHEYPGVEITLTEEGSGDLLDGVRDGRLDLVIAALAAIPVAWRCTRSPTRRCSPPSRPATLSPRGRRSPSRRSPRVSFICLPPGTGLRAILDGAFATADLRPRVAFEASDPAVLAQFAARGLGVAVLPESLARGRPGRCHRIAIARPALRGRLALAWRAERPASPAARALVAHARRALGAEG